VSAAKWAVYVAYAYGARERGEILSVHRTHPIAEKAIKKSANPTLLGLAEVPSHARAGWRYTGDSVFDQCALPPRGPGRPQMGKEARKRYQVMLEPRLRDKAEQIGKGNFSAGITRVLEEYNG
jgi:hypothetical protein